MKVSFITTVNHNVGDDFVREGILHLLRLVLPNFESALVHKHIPITARPEWEWLYHTGTTDFMARIRPGLPRRATDILDRALPLRRSDRITSSQLLIQSGAPIFWIHGPVDSLDAEWWEPLLRRRWESMSPRIPFLNLAGGTCQPFASDGAEFGTDAERLNRIRNLFDIATLTTVRDDLSQVVFGLAGRDAPRLPCTSIFSADSLGIPAATGRYVVFNYMDGGGHFDLAQNINGQRWLEIFRNILHEVSTLEKVVLVCHNTKELQSARRHFAGIPTFYSTTYADYLRFYAEAKYGLVNRVHAAFAMASVGKPAVVVGSDSRARMGSILGLPVQFAGDASNENVRDHLDKVKNSVGEFSQRIHDIKREARDEYERLLSEALEGKL
jgi:hypothetical protein